MVQPLLTGISQLPMYEEEQEIVDVIQAFVSSPEKVTTAISNTAVLESADRGSAARLLEVCWLGRAASPRPPTQHCTPSAPVPLAVCPQLSHSLFVSLSPGCQEEGQKMKFLKSICNLCTSTRSLWERQLPTLHPLWGTGNLANFKGQSRRKGEKM
ncbi:uncharacterized protein ACIBXB_005935 isoform 1-T2 [Morphnus guianensis]